MSRWKFEKCTGCDTGEVCGNKGYQPARDVSDATMTAALEAGTDQVVTPCTLGRCAPLVCVGGRHLDHPPHVGDGACPTCSGAAA